MTLVKARLYSMQLRVFDISTAFAAESHANATGENCGHQSQRKAGFALKLARIQQQLPPSQHWLFGVVAP